MTFFESTIRKSEHELFRGLLGEFGRHWEHDPHVKLDRPRKGLVFYEAGSFGAPLTGGIYAVFGNRKGGVVILKIAVLKKLCESEDRNEILEYLLGIGTQVVDMASFQFKKAGRNYDSQADRRFLEEYRRRMLS